MIFHQPSMCQQDACIFRALDAMNSGTDYCILNMLRQMNDLLSIEPVTQPENKNAFAFGHADVLKWQSLDVIVLQKKVLPVTIKCLEVSNPVATEA